ncbi:hypothetical protein CR513_62567, partial [Mucuna pruriens]
MGHRTPSLSFKLSKLKRTLAKEMTDSTTTVPWNLAGNGHALVGHPSDPFDIFDIKQNKGKTLKSYLARFNNIAIRVNDLDKKNFVKAFQKGLRVGQFSDSFALRKP